MTESQIKKFEEIVQQIAKSDGINFDAACDIAIGVLKLHAIDNLPSGVGKAGGPA